METQSSTDGQDPAAEIIKKSEKPEPDIYDPFAPENLKLPQEFLDQIATVSLLCVIPVEKPSDQEFIRVHPTYEHLAALITHQAEMGARYLVDKHFLPFVAEHNIKFHYEQLYLYTTRQGRLAFWPIKIRNDNRENTWLDSAEAAKDEAREKWVCITSNQHDRMYRIAKALAEFPEPDWQKITQGMALSELLRRAFKERLIMGETHPLIQKLLGAV
jgi:hypothetical protein